MEKNKLSEGVGKKIVEALKKQSEIDVLHNDNEFNSINNFESEALADEEVFESLNQENQNFEEIEPKNDVKKEENLYTNPSETIISQTFNAQNFQENEQPVNFSSNWELNSQAIDEAFNNQMNNFNQTTNIHKNVNNGKTFDIPPNVAVLKRLISQLPTGVTKQTGAQIIKQTMEALGISMNTVLHEAQKIQEELNEATKDCSSTIQEYINNIKALEKQAHDYQRQTAQLNDLISLFILTEK